MKRKFLGSTFTKYVKNFFLRKRHIQENLKELEIKENDFIEKEYTKSSVSKISFDFAINYPKFNAKFNISWDKICQDICDNENTKLNKDFDQEDLKISEMIHIANSTVQKEVQVSAETFRVFNIEPIPGKILTEKVSVREEVEIEDQEIVKQPYSKDKIVLPKDKNICLENNIDLSNNSDHLMITPMEEENSFKLNKLRINWLRSYEFLESFKPKIKAENYKSKERKIQAKENSTKLSISQFPTVPRNSVSDTSENIEISLKKNSLRPKNNSEKYFGINCMQNGDFDEKYMESKIMKTKSTCDLPENNFSLDSSMIFSTSENHNVPELTISSQNSVNFKEAMDNEACFYKEKH